MEQDNVKKLSPKPKVSFSKFLEKFPEITPPVTLGEDTHLSFSRMNDPLTPLMIEQFIAPYEEMEIDDLTEFISCFRIKGIKDFHAIVFWRASLMDYRYVLATYSKTGEQIDQRVIAGTYSDGELITRSVSTVEEDWTVAIVSGQVKASGESIDTSNTTAFSLEIMPDGTIENS